MTQPLNPGGFARRTLWGIGAAQLVPEVKGVRLLRGQLGQLVHPGDHADRNPAGINQFHRDPADDLWQRAGRPPGRAGEPLDVRPAVCRERRAHEPRARSAADDHTHRAGARSAKVKLVGGVQHGGEAERPGEGCRADQVWFLEFQPRQIADLDQRVAGAPGVLPAQRALLAVQVFVGVDMGFHRVSSLD
jgi:hypothetical protein